MEQVSNHNTPPGRALTDWLYTKASKRRIPLNGTFELSPVCNFSCRMCYVRKTQKEVQESPRKILSLEDWLTIAREAREAGMLYLLLTGGEPLLWPHFWTLYDALIDMGFLISINTNGSLIDSEAISHFKRKPPQKISVTLYGASDETYKQLCGVGGVFSRVDKAICGLAEAGITVKLNCSLIPDNAMDLDKILDYAQQHSITLAATTYMFPPVRRDPSMVGKNSRFTPEDAAAYLMHYIKRDRGEAAYQFYIQRILDGFIDPPGLDEGCIDPVDGHIRCRAGSDAFWITWDGWMTPCGLMSEPKADLKTQSFQDAWNMLTDASAKLRLSGVCETCGNRNICHPCAAIAYAETGTAEGIPTYKCRITQELHKIACESAHFEDKAQSPPPSE